MAKNKSGQKGLKVFFSGRRLYIILAVAALLGVIVAVRSCTSRVKPDLIISYIGENYFSSEAFYDNVSVLEEVIDDINGDGKKYIEISVIPFTSNVTAAQQQSNLAKNTMSVGQGKSRVYIIDKAYAQNIYKNQDVLADLSDFVSEGDDVLTDENGVVYAISVEGNKLLEKLGLDDSEDVYIALRKITEMDHVNYKNPGPEEMTKVAEAVIKQIINENKRR